MIPHNLVTESGEEPGHTRRDETGDNGKFYPPQVQFPSGSHELLSLLRRSESN
jgi:hypothetical protein